MIDLITKANLSAYESLSKLTVCSNTIIGGGQMFKYKNDAPLIIGYGDTPILWINAFSTSDLLPVVIANVDISNKLIISPNKKLKKIVVQFGDVIIIDASMSEPKTCLVNNLDLRPFGFEIHGNDKGLFIAGNSFIGNTMNGSEYFFAIG